MSFKMSRVTQMKTFPSSLTPENLTHLRDLARRRRLAYMRRYVYENMLSDSFSIPENCGINLQQIETGSLVSRQYSVDISLIGLIQKELENNGWKTALGYGNTMLFVYTENNKPKDLINCSGL